ncbi:hypothetical protein [Alteromonas sp. S005]|uniref:hypothetical protein n=1 Tax=Alteromonas sp. S005 TaxID=3117400 RepID=UPI002FE225A2
MHNSDKENHKIQIDVAELDRDDALSALWQAQSVTAINLTEVKENLRSERTKQRWYMVIDSLAFIPAIYLLITSWDKFTFVAHAMFIFMLVTALPLLVYQLWLRRVAAFSKDTQTVDHLIQLTKQIKNNVKIAFITKHSTWTAVLFGYAFLLERYFFGDPTPEKITKMAIVMTLLSIGMLIWYVWAHKRQKRFECQLEILETMVQHR